MNAISLTDDRMKMTIKSEDGLFRAELHSARQGGFTDEEVSRAIDYKTVLQLVGQRSMSWRKSVGRHHIYAHLMTGPPTWWRPKVTAGRWHFGIGWLRAYVVVAVK